MIFLKKLNFMNRIYHLILLCLFLGCSKEKALKNANFWKYAGGDYIQDLIIFDENYTLKKDTIYYLDQPQYLILDYKKNIIWGPEEIWISPLNRNLKSRFVAK